jgi:integrase
MARVFRQQYTQRTPDGERVTRQSAKWYVEYRDAQGIRRRVPGYTDKAATQQLASELERQAAREQSGLVDRYAAPRKRPLSEHIADYEASLRGRGLSERHVATLIPRIRKVLAGCRFNYWPDMSASKVQAYIAELRRGGLSIQSTNFYLQAVKQLCRWCVQDGRAPDSPLVHLSGDNVRTDRRHDRRALDAAELRRLLESARTGPTRFGMTGPARAMLYQLAAESGLRAGELRSLAWDSFDLSDDPPTVTVRAAYSKHRRDDTLPLKASTAQMLARWRDESGPVDREHPVFAMPDKTARMIRADLADADIEYRDADGRVCDFHALRHSFVSALARGGVHPKIAQQLARHSTITLTMDRYSHTIVGELAAGLQALPDLSPRPNAERLRATGTADRLPNCLPLSLPKKHSSRGWPRATECSETEQAPSHGRGVKFDSVGTSDSDMRFDASTCKLRRAGFEPATFGSVDRCSIQLS